MLIKCGSKSANKGVHLAHDLQCAMCPQCNQLTPTLYIHMHIYIYITQKVLLSIVLPLLPSLFCSGITGLILGLHPVSERRRYFVTTSLVGWAQIYNQPCITCHVFIHRVHPIVVPHAFIVLGYKRPLAIDTRQTLRQEVSLAILNNPAWSIKQSSKLLITKKHEKKHVWLSRQRLSCWWPYPTFVGWWPSLFSYACGYTRGWLNGPSRCRSNLCHFRSHASGIGLVPPGNKPLPQAMSTQICVAIFLSDVIYPYRRRCVGRIHLLWPNGQSNLPIIGYGLVTVRPQSYKWISANLLSVGFHLEHISMAFQSKYTHFLNAFDDVDIYHGSWRCHTFGCHYIYWCVQCEENQDLLE